MVEPVVRRAKPVIKWTESEIGSLKRCMDSLPEEYDTKLATKKACEVYKERIFADSDRTVESIYQFVRLAGSKPSHPLYSTINRPPADPVFAGRPPPAVAEPLPEEHASPMPTRPSAVSASLHQEETEAADPAPVPDDAVVVIDGGRCPPTKRPHSARPSERARPGKRLTVSESVVYAADNARARGVYCRYCALRQIWTDKSAEFVEPAGPRCSDDRHVYFPF